MAMNVMGMVGWVGGWVVLLEISTRSPNWVAWAFMPYFVYGPYRAVIQIRYFPAACNMLRTLREYPWQVLYGVPRGIDEHPDAESSGVWIELPHPAGSLDKGVPLTFVKHHRAFWWLRRIGGPRTKTELKRQLEPLLFAGDPRFLGVIAAVSASGRPKRLHFLYQPSAFDEKANARRWVEVNPVDLERARRGGARRLDAVLPVIPEANNQEGTGA
ncbi:hypothetical protein [Streptomyces griseomycini]|uniref:hypothetical protein n=1 Tax=Streptomyces griseomycini TaxID=66895 RepID=UPI0018747DCE|nr:hypothetical protein [Streptomyces griseomycini]